MQELLEGFRLIRQPGIRVFVIVPIAVNILVFAAIFYFGYSAIDEWISGWVADLPEWLSFLSFLAWIVASVISLGLLFFTFTMIANLIASPFNGLLAERVMVHMGVRPLDGGIKSLLALLPRSIAREFAKIFYFLPRFLGLLLLSLIPGVNFLAPVLWLLFGAWMMTLQYADYAADNRQVTFSDMKQRLGRQRMASIEFGIIVYLMMAVPLLNLLVLPAAVAGGTVFWIRRIEPMAQ